MSSFDDPTPIATVEQFAKALLVVRAQMTDKHFELLRLHCRAPEHTVTAAYLAEAAGLRSPSTANLMYGKYAHWMADALKYVPDQRDDGTVRWWRALAYGRPGAPETKDGKFEWIMRPELVAALQSMRWA